MEKDIIVKTEITIKAPLAQVWDALINPDVIKQYMFGTIVVSDWDIGSPIIWKGEWEGKKYLDKGMIMKLEPEHLIQYSHMSGADEETSTKDRHIVTIELSKQGEEVKVHLTQDSNKTEKAREESLKNWNMMLLGMKKILEK